MNQRLVWLEIENPGGVHSKHSEVGEVGEVRQVGKTSPGRAIETPGFESELLKDRPCCHVENGRILASYGKGLFLLSQND